MKFSLLGMLAHIFFFAYHHHCHIFVVVLNTFHIHWPEKNVFSLYLLIIHMIPIVSVGIGFFLSVFGSFSNALFVIDQNSRKTKLIRIVCEYEKHNRSGHFNYFCIFRNVRTMYIIMIIKIVLDLAYKLLHEKAKWSHVVPSNQIFHNVLNAFFPHFSRENTGEARGKPNEKKGTKIHTQGFESTSNKHHSRIKRYVIRMMYCIYINQCKSRRKE